jgi:hypothetical protein
MIPATLSRFITLAALLLLGMPGAAVAEAAKSPQGDVGRIDRLKQSLAAEGKQQPELAPTLLPKEQLDPETARSMQQSLKAYYDYRSHGFEHRKAVFAWQLLSAKIIFAIVVALVAVGIYFSWIQLSAGMRGKTAPASALPAGRPADLPATIRGETAAPSTPAVTTLEASPSGIRVSSPVIGVILLVISLAFFYLYLAYVYPIEEIF